LLCRIPMAKIFRLILLLLAYVSISACADELATLNWLKVNESYFELSLPNSFKKVVMHGEDSFVGEYKSETITLSFDYGPYSDTLQNKHNHNQYKEWREQINGHEAKMVTYTKSNTEFVMAIHFPKGGQPYKSGNKLTVFSIYHSKRDYDVVREIYKSIRFKE